MKDNDLKKFRKNNFDVNVADFAFATEIWEWMNFATIYPREMVQTEAEMKSRNQLRDDIYNSMFKAYPNLKNYKIGGDDFMGVWAEEVSHIFIHGDAKCVACNSRIKYKMPFHNTGDNGFPEFVIAGKDCSIILDQETDFEAYAIRQKEAEELARQKQEWADNIEKFNNEYPALKQATEYFLSQDWNFQVMEDIYSKVKWGLSEKQIAYLEKLVIKQWANEVIYYKKQQAKPLKAGLQEIPVIIKKYYVKEGHNGYYASEKVAFVTDHGQSIYCNKTQKLLTAKVWTNWIFRNNNIQEDKSFLELWDKNLTKKERRSQFSDNQYYSEYTKGILKIDLIVSDNDETVGFGKIIEFTPTDIDYVNNDHKITNVLYEEE